MKLPIVFQSSVTMRTWISKDQAISSLSWDRFIRPDTVATTSPLTPAWLKLGLAGVLEGARACQRLRLIVKGTVLMWFPLGTSVSNPSPSSYAKEKSHCSTMLDFKECFLSSDSALSSGHSFSGNHLSQVLWTSLSLERLESVYAQVTLTT